MNVFMAVMASSLMVSLEKRGIGKSHLDSFGGSVSIFCQILSEAISWVTESVKYKDMPEKIMLQFSTFLVPQWTSPVFKDNFVSENCDLEV